MTKRFFDAALVLRDGADGAETSSVAETGVAFDALKAGAFKAVFAVAALDTAGGDETYVLSVETDSLAAFSDAPVQVGSVAITAAGTYEVLLSQDGIARLDANAAAIRCKATLGGETASIAYSAFLSPL